jgi:predicted Zn-ribbon and HTH transcriptional regulator
MYIPDDYNWHGDYEDIIEEFENDWHIGQSYEERFVKQLRCKKCGSDKFEVGHDSCYTAIRCPVCLYEICIHDG